MKPDTPEIKYVWIDDSQLSYEKLGTEENIEKMLKVNENLTCVHHRWIDMKSWCELGQCPCIHEPCLFFVNKFKEWERQRDENTERLSEKNN